MLQPAVDEARGEITIDQLELLIRRGESNLLLWDTPDGIAAAVAIEFHNFPSLRVAHVAFLGEACDSSRVFRGTEGMVRVARGFRNQGMVRRGASEVVSFHRVCRAIPNRGGEIMLIRSQFSGYQNGIRSYNKGGGGGGSTYYANQDKLLGVQADIAQGIYNNIYQPYAPGATADLNAMRTEDLATKARNTAGPMLGRRWGRASTP